MSGKRRKLLRDRAMRAQGPPRGRLSKLRKLAMPLGWAALLAAAIPLVIRVANDRKAVSQAVAAPLHVIRKAKTLDELIAMSEEKLSEVDVAEMNLLCAAGLPGSENLDIDHALATLDQWAKRVAFETNRHLYRVTDPRYAKLYRNSEAYLRAYMLLQVLQCDLGVKYDMAAKDDFSFADSRVAFIHGMIPAPGQTTKDTPGGTCASMPVMYVAVGRRLGYPLKLATTKGHVFVRWDGMGSPNPPWRERFNIEGAGDGFSSFDDDYYKTWPFKISDEEVRANGYLVSLTPLQEFAQFIAARGHCGEDHGKYLFAARCYENAYRADPCLGHRGFFLEAARRCDYRAGTPELATLLVRRTGFDPESIIAKQRADQMAKMRRSGGADYPFAGGRGGSGLSPADMGPWYPQNPGVVQPPLPPHPNMGRPPPAAARPYQPPTPGYAQSP